MVAVTCRFGTGNIEQDAAGGAFLSHEGLRVRAWKLPTVAVRFAHTQPAGPWLCRDHSESLNNFECCGAHIVVDGFSAPHFFSAKVHPEVLGLSEKSCMLVAVVNGHTASLRRPIITCFDPGSGPKGRCALVTGHLDDFEEGGIGIGRAEECVVPSDFADCLLRKRPPSLLGTTQEPRMQTAIAEGHRPYLSVLLW